MDKIFKIFETTLKFSSRLYFLLAHNFFEYFPSVLIGLFLISQNGEGKGAETNFENNAISGAFISHFSILFVRSTSITFVVFFFVYVTYFNNAEWLVPLRNLGFNSARIGEKGAKMR